jgi:ParB family transcriptional regulator, chromosome partitioning protein
MTTEKRKVLGRGLETLLPPRHLPHAPAVSSPPKDDDVLHLPLDQLEPNPYQTRSGSLDPASLAELAASIKAVGVLQPIVVRPTPGGRYQIIAGERRWEATRQAGLATIPALIRHVSNEQAMEMTIIENLLREDLNPVEQARAFERLGRDFGLTQDQMAIRVGKDRASIANFMRLLKLPPSVLSLIERGHISLSHAKLLLALPTPDQMDRLALRIFEEGLSVRYTQDTVDALTHPKPREVKERQVEANVRHAENVLQQTLGVKVQINDRQGKGKIVIEYHSLDDYDRILAALGVKQ